MFRGNDAMSLWWNKININEEVIDLKCNQMHLEVLHHHLVTPLHYRKQPLIMRSLGRKQPLHLMRIFSVDVLLISLQSFSEALELIQNVTNMGGLNLAKFTSNNQKVLVKILKAKRRKLRMKTWWLETFLRRTN